MSRLADTFNGTMDGLRDIVRGHRGQRHQAVVWGDANQRIGERNVGRS